MASSAHAAAAAKKFRDGIGNNLNVGVMLRYKTDPTGTYWNVGGTVDAVRRLITYRVIDGFPLVALVGTAKSEIYKYSVQNARIYYGIAFVLILVIGAAIGLGAARERKLIAMSRSLRHANDVFEAALASLPHGLCVYDGDQRLLVCNEPYWKMYGLTGEDTRVGMTLRDVFEARVRVGSVPRNADEYISRGLVNAERFESTQFIEELQDGRTLGIGLGAIPSGGWVSLHQDITARKRAEAEITHLAPRRSDCALLTASCSCVRSMKRPNAAAPTTPLSPSHILDPRPLQGSQRHTRPCLRRPAAAHRRAAPARGRRGE